MKITNHEVIQSGEQELIDAITADLDWETIEEIFRQAHNLKIEDNVEYKKGDIVVYNDQIAYQLDFDVNVVLSVLLDRQGNYISVTTSGDLNALKDERQDNLLNEPQNQSKDSGKSISTEQDLPDISENDDEASARSHEKESQEKITEIASQAEQVISEIQAEDQAMTDTA